MISSKTIKSKTVSHFKFQLGLEHSLISKLILNPQEVHIWVCAPEEIYDPELLSMYQQLLDKVELSRMNRFHFAKRRHEYLVSHALVRTILSYYDGIPPAQRRFVRNYYGKPEIIDKQNSLGLHFNLSHTNGMIVCGVTLYNELGVDIENRVKHHELFKIAYKYFSEEEISELKKYPLALRGKHFFNYWTLKESYVKACGRGLSIPLDNFSFTVQPDKRITISFTKERDDIPDDWFFWLLEPSEIHTMAIAVRAKNHPTHIPLITREIVPLQKVKALINKPT
jgi:4'-phosphopantetheinyl transferase